MKVLRVVITDEDYEAWKKNTYYGEISHVVREAVHTYLRDRKAKSLLTALSFPPSPLPLEIPRAIADEKLAIGPTVVMHHLEEGEENGKVPNEKQKRSVGRGTKEGKAHPSRRSPRSGGGERG